MKKNFWLCLGLLLATGVLAQTANPPPSPGTRPAGATPTDTNTPATPAPAPTAAVDTNAVAGATTNTPTRKSAAQKKKAGKKKANTKQAAKKKDAAAELRSVPLVAGQAVVIASNVNVRGQAKLNSEVITRLNKGKTVSVLEEVHLKKSGPDEPSAWAKIILPAGTHVWVNGKYVDATNKTVTANKLKVRGGPSEAYSVLGIIKKGDELKQVDAKGDWIEIEAPAEASGFVAAQYLKQEEPAALTEPTTVAEAPQIAPPTNETLTATAPATNELAGAQSGTNATGTAIEEPPPRRIVQREGVVRGTFSIQAPTKYELISPQNGRAINYLYTTSPSLDLSRYKGMHIIVTGEEGLDERWHNTPIITIQRIQVLE